jgi:hypothetical protein
MVTSAGQLEMRCAVRGEEVVQMMLGGDVSSEKGQEKRKIKRYSLRRMG